MWNFVFDALIDLVTHAVTELILALGLHLVTDIVLLEPLGL